MTLVLLMIGVPTSSLWAFGLTWLLILKHGYVVALVGAVFFLFLLTGIHWFSDLDGGELEFGEVWRFSTAGAFFMWMFLLACCAAAGAVSGFAHRTIRHFCG